MRADCLPRCCAQQNRFTAAVRAAFLRCARRHAACRAAAAAPRARAATRAALRRRTSRVTRFPRTHAHFVFSNSIWQRKAWLAKNKLAAMKRQSHRLASLKMAASAYGAPASSAAIPAGSGSNKRMACQPCSQSTSAQPRASGQYPLCNKLVRQNACINHMAALLWAASGR